MEASTPLLAGSPARYAGVALNLPLRRSFTYRIPPGVTCAVGNRVLVPFRGRRLPGVVVATSDRADIAADKVRDLAAVLDPTLQLPPALLGLAQRIADDYGTSLGEALDAMLPAMAKRRGVKRIPHLQLSIPVDVARTALLELEDKHPSRARVLRAVLEGGEQPLLQVLRRTNTSDSPWKTLVKQGMLRRVLVEERGEPLAIESLEPLVDHRLNDEQAAALAAIDGALRAGRHETFLLHGVTGSGKTEVYLRALATARSLGKSAIVLVPEIALTPQTVGRFAARFADVAVLHSGLTDAERGAQWRRLMTGAARVAIGARSALFAPLTGVGLIVLDEEQEGSFKQESKPRYHAREVAIARAQLEGAVVVLGSATPTLESYGRARSGRYTLLELKRRAGAGTLPKVLVVDLRAEGKEAYVDGVAFAHRLRVLVAEKLRAREQVILLQNRRGYAPVLLCPTCGKPVQCRRCAVSMAFHAKRGRLICHYCCEERRRPELCEHCGHAGFHELGAGTERVAAAVTKLFPEAIVARMDADTMAERGAHERVLSSFRKKQIDVLVGTQMVAKGHDFPAVTLVGVINADQGLFLPDFRAAERTFQLLFQVAGRAGRGDRPGTVVMQTLCPDSYAVRAAAELDFESFVEQELRYRREAKYPPYSRLVRVLFEGRDEAATTRAAEAARKRVPERSDVQALGPAPAVVPKIKDRHRVQILVKAMTHEGFAAVVGAVRDLEEDTDQRMRVIVDVDPLSML